jgi:hypothetical protein
VTLQVSLLHVLYFVPANANVLSSILDRHEFDQAQGISFKSVGVTTSVIGQAYLNLPNDATRSTLNPWERRDHVGHLVANWQRLKHSLTAPSPNHVLALATRAAHPMRLWLNVRVKYLILYLGLGHTIAMDSKETVQL